MTPAIRAREILATTGEGTLHIHGIGHLGPCAAGILLYDDSGRPTFLCEVGSPVTQAAHRHRSAVLAVRSPEHGVEMAGDDVAGVVLAGHLTVVGTERVDGLEVPVIALILSSVLIVPRDSTSGTIARRGVSLSEYFAVDPDPIDAAARRILDHTNASHAVEMREYTAAIRGVPLGEIASAELTELDMFGLLLHWIDARGAHVTRIEFPSPADGPATMASRLLETLTGTRR